MVVGLFVLVSPTKNELQGLAVSLSQENLVPTEFGGSMAKICEDSYRIMINVYGCLKSAQIKNP